MTKRNAVDLLAAAIFAAGLASIGMGQPAAAAVVHKVGQITWHARQFVDQDVTLTGYVLVQEKDYVLFSDEPKGRVSAHDLPVTGAGLDRMKPMTRYVIAGRFLDHGVKASNGNKYHLELSVPPEEAKP